PLPLAAAAAEPAAGPRGRAAGRRPLALRPRPGADDPGRRLPHAAAAGRRVAAGAPPHLRPGAPSGSPPTVPALGRLADPAHAVVSRATGALLGRPVAYPLRLRDRFRAHADRLGAPGGRHLPPGGAADAGGLPLPGPLERGDPPAAEGIPRAGGRAARSRRLAPAQADQSLRGSALPFRAAGDLPLRLRRGPRRRPRRRLGRRSRALRAAGTTAGDAELSAAAASLGGEGPGRGDPGRLPEPGRRLFRRRHDLRCGLAGVRGRQAAADLSDRRLPARRGAAGRRAPPGPALWGAARRRRRRPFPARPGRRSVPRVWPPPKGGIIRRRLPALLRGCHLESASPHRRLAALLPLLLGAGWLLCLLGPLLLPDRALANRDIAIFHIPLRAIFKDLAELGPPVWNPWLHGGQPILPNPSYGAFYPPSWLVFAATPAYALNLMAVLHAAIAFAGSWRLDRKSTRLNSSHANSS